MIQPYYHNGYFWIMIIGITLAIMLANILIKKEKDLINICKICKKKNPGVNSKEHYEICCNCAHERDNITHESTGSTI